MLVSKILGCGGTGKAYVVQKDNGNFVVRKQAFSDVEGADAELANQEKTYRRLQPLQGSTQHIAHFYTAGKTDDENKFIQIEHFPDAIDLYRIITYDDKRIDINRDNWKDICGAYHKFCHMDARQRDRSW